MSQLGVTQVEEDRTPEDARALSRQAAKLGVPIEYLGVQALFEEIRAYRGRDRDWVLAPLQLDPIFLAGGGRLPVPRANLEQLRRLVDGGVDFPAAYIAHDVPHGSIQQGAPVLETDRAIALRGEFSGRPTILDPQAARRVVSPVPAPGRTVELSRRYGHACDMMLKAVTVAATSVVGIAMAPLLVIPAAFSGFTDPVIFGALPTNGIAESGSEAAWFALTRWEY